MTKTYELPNEKMIMADVDEKRHMATVSIYALDDLVRAVNKSGHWEWVQYDYNPKLGDWHCSECRCVVLECVDKEKKGGIPLYKYCPQCGAKMVEPQDKDIIWYDKRNYSEIVVKPQEKSEG